MPAFFQSFQRSLRAGQHFFMHHSHENQYCQQKYRVQKCADMVCQKTEHRRHKTGSHVSGCHLHPDHRLRFIRSEMGRRGMYDRRVNGGAAKTRNDQPAQSGSFTERQQQEHSAAQDQPLPKPDHLRIV